jgi:putative endonuclease
MAVEDRFFPHRCEVEKDLMWVYVYILELSNGNHYVGCTADIKKRYSRHKAGLVTATKPHLPLKLVWCCSFSDRYKAYEFEKYLKSGSGRAFAKKHLL